MNPTHSAAVEILDLPPGTSPRVQSMWALLGDDIPSPQDVSLALSALTIGDLARPSQSDFQSYGDVAAYGCLHDSGQLNRAYSRVHFLFAPVNPGHSDMLALYCACIGHDRDLYSAELFMQPPAPSATPVEVRRFMATAVSALIGPDSPCLRPGLVYRDIGVRARGDEGNVTRAAHVALHFAAISEIAMHAHGTAMGLRAIGALNGRPLSCNVFSPGAIALAFALSPAPAPTVEIPAEAELETLSRLMAERYGRARRWHNCVGVPSNELLAGISAQGATWWMNGSNELAGVKAAELLASSPLAKAIAIQASCLTDDQIRMRIHTRSITAFIKAGGAAAADAFVIEHVSNGYHTEPSGPPVALTSAIPPARSARLRRKGP